MNADEYVNCEICGSDCTEPLYPVAECTGIYTGETFNLVKCRNCGLVYVNPRPTAKELPKYYPQESYYAYKEIENEKKSLKSRIKNFLSEWAGGYKVDENKRIFGINKLLTWIVKVSIKNILIGIVPSKKGGWLLDIGCGNGAFLKWHKEHGWDVYGIEVNKEAVKLCKEKSVEVFEGELIDAGFVNETFDAITLIQALEHLPNPSSILKEIHRILKRDGLVLIGVPNFGCFDRKLYNSKWLPLEVPRHLYHFELQTLKKLLENNGFKVLEVRAKGFYFLGLKNLRLLRKQGLNNYIRSLLILSIIKPILLIISKSRKERFGELICVYCQKML